MANQLAAFIKQEVLTVLESPEARAIIKSITKDGLEAADTALEAALPGPLKGVVDPIVQTAIGAVLTAEDKWLDDAEKSLAAPAPAPVKSPAPAPAK